MTSQRFLSRVIATISDTLLRRRPKRMPEKLHNHDDRYNKPGHGHAGYAVLGHYHPDGQSPQGLPSRDGLDGLDGKDGNDGLDGRDGAQGPQGPPGPAFYTDATGFQHEFGPIRVPVDIVVIKEAGQYPTIDEIFYVRRQLDTVTRFYARHGIALRFSIKGLSVHDKTILDYIGRADAMSHLFYNQAQGTGLTGYVGIDNAFIGPEGNGWVGQIASLSGPYGSFMAAGAFPTRFELGQSSLDQIIIHELGHMFEGGTNEDHVPGTYLDAVISSSEVVLPEQLERMRARALEWAS